MPFARLNCSDAEGLASLLSKVGADMRCLPFFRNKSEIKSLFIPNADVRAANVIKQEMLSLGGDAAVNAGAISSSVTRSDVVLFGAQRQLEALADKLSVMPWWGLAGITAELRESLAALASPLRPALLPCGTVLPFGERTLIMGILNLTDDSFYEKSRTGRGAGAALARALRFAEEGADVLDLGAESTRPGAERVPEETEAEAVIPAVREIRKRLPKMPISVDTTRAAVAERALAEGADIINDVSGLACEPETAKAAAEHNAMLILMHMRGTPRTMSSLCDYGNILAEISEFFESGIKKAAGFGLARDRIILDPGIGFAKNAGQNLFLMKNAGAFRTFGLPVLMAASRKSAIGEATGTPDAEDRLAGTIAVSVLSSWFGADMVRVHDVLENKRAIMMAEAIKRSGWDA